MKKEKEHLSLYGIGPVYAAVSAVLTLTVCLLDSFRRIPRLTFAPAEGILKVCAGICLVLAAALWLNAVFTQKIDRHIVRNELVTEGAYAWVRNPIYSAIMFVMWAALAWTGNLYLLLLCPIYPLLMTVLLKHTEEKWLTARYGQVYLDYCREVHRCFPWFPAHKHTQK